MIPLSPARRAAEEFDALVEGRGTDAAARHADLLAYVGMLRDHEPPAARTDFVADLRSQLMSAADTLLVPAEDAVAPVIPIKAPTRGRRRASVVAATLIVLGGSAGVAAAAEQALPGDPLYPLKRTIESAQVSLSGNDANRAAELLDQASTRLDEVAQLVQTDASGDTINHTLAAYQRSAGNGADLVFLDFQRTNDPAPIAALRSSLADQLAELQSLSAVAPSTSAESFTKAMTSITQLDQQALLLCSGCGPTDALSNSPTLSQAALTSLLSAPADQAAIAEARDRLAALADKAGKFAGKPTATPTTGTTPDLSVPTDTPTLPGLPDPTTLSTGSDPTTTLTSGLDTLVNQLNTVTDDVLQPLTDTIDETTSSVDGLLQ